MLELITQREAGIMTTPAAARLYEVQHLCEMKGRKVAVFNPQDKAIDELPVIYGFNNGGSRNFLSAQLIAQDGTFLGGHLCSSEGYMPNDLGILEGSRLDRHEGFKKHYPDGYRMEFVSYNKCVAHSGLNKAIERNTTSK